MKPHRRKTPIGLTRPSEDIVEFDAERAQFRGGVKPRVARALMGFLFAIRRAGASQTILDFSQSTAAYPNAMVPIVARCQSLIREGFQVDCILPTDDTLRRLFLRTNWAHYIAPHQFAMSDTEHDRHLAVRNFADPSEQQLLVNDFIDVTMRTLQLPRSVLGGLEWAVNEITDNVLNHASSANGGFVQLATYRERQRIVFCVADTGRGILDSLREARPLLRLDVDAIGDAVRAGVTRNKNIGQGNGLSGTLAIINAVHGHMAIASGAGNISWSDVGVDTHTSHLRHRFDGTVVDVQIPTNVPLDLPKALALGTDGRVAAAVDFVELNYLSDDSRSVNLRMIEETAGFGSRRAGQQMRTKAANLLNAEPTCTLVVDWNGIQMISSSYADEFIGKLFVAMGPIAFMSKIRQINAIPLVHGLIDKAIMQRTQQEMTR